MGVNKNAAQYATAGTAKKFWCGWKESFTRDQLSLLRGSINTPLSERDQRAVAKTLINDQWPMVNGTRSITAQDKAIYSLCRPERLLDLAYRFTLFDGGIKKIARYQQFFVVRATIKRVQQKDGEGRRQGGIHLAYPGFGQVLDHGMAGPRPGLGRGDCPASDYSGHRPG
ncbi:hypothetical protein [Nitrosococcus oceani]|uniref:hypothetical protein n=1 Tax=Nitrosococcus oceani TaxID=1229 RepID=UPI001FD35A11|nr:hypothetical protein [Nitrosococcus oceani]